MRLEKIKSIAFMYVVHQSIVLSTIYLGHVLYTKPQTSKTFWEIITTSFANWDGRWFLKVAEKGYDLKSAAFFPLYPGLIKVMVHFGSGPVVAGIIISNISLFGVCWLFYELMALDYPHELCVRALWLLIIFPTAFYFNMVYSESLFLLLVLLTFYAARLGKWWLAAVSGILAAMTRNLGTLLVIPVYYEYVLRSDFKLRNIKADVILPALIPSGLAIYMFYLWRTLGDPLAFGHAQKFWGRTFTFPWEAVFISVSNIVTDNFRGRNLLDLIFTMGAIFVVIFSVKKIRTSYWLYMSIGLIIPMLAASPQAGLFSMPRFLLVLFPIYIALAKLVENEQLRLMTISYFAGLFVYLGILVSFSRWVA